MDNFSPNQPYQESHLELTSLSPEQVYWLTLPGSLTQAIKDQIDLPFTLEVLNEYTEVVEDLSELSPLISNQASPILNTPSKSAPSRDLVVIPTIYVREVMMSLGGIPIIIARSRCFIEDSISPQAWEAMRNLGNIPLASILYQDPTIERTPFVQGELLEVDPLYPLWIEQQPYMLHALAEHGYGGDALWEISPPTESSTTTPDSASLLTTPTEPTRNFLDALSPSLQADIPLYPYQDQPVYRSSVFVRNGAPLEVRELFLPSFWRLI